MAAYLHPVNVSGMDNFAACSTQQNAHALANKINAVFGDDTAVVDEPILFNPSHASALAALKSAGFAQVAQS